MHHIIMTSVTSAADHPYSREAFALFGRSHRLAHFLIGCVSMRWYWRCTITEQQHTSCVVCYLPATDDYLKHKLKNFDVSSHCRSFALVFCRFVLLECQVPVGLARHTSASVLLSWRQRCHVGGYMCFLPTCFRCIVCQ